MRAVLATALLFIILMPSPAFANCTNPSAGAGDQFFNTAYDVMQYCNGSVWINMGTVLGIGTLTPGDFCTTDGTNVYCTIASPLAVPSGGTGTASFANNGILLGQGTSALVTIGTAANSILISNGSGVPSFSTSLPSGVIIGTSSISGVLSVPQGGTGENSLTANGVLYGNGTSAVSALTGTSGYLLQFNGASLAPTAVSSLSGTILGNIASLPNLTSAGSLATVGTLTGGSTGAGFTVNFGSSTLSGTVPVANGGTGQTTAQAARGSGSTNTVQGLNIEEMTIPASSGNTAYNILNTDRTVAVGTTALTAARTWYLPLGSTVNAGQTVCIVDKGGGVNSTDTLTVAGAQGSSDTVEPSSAATLKTQYGSACFASDGGNPAKWTSVGGGAGVPGGSDTQVQFNDQGAFQGNTNLVWNYTDGYLGVGTSSGMNTTLYVNGTTTSNVVHFAGGPGGNGANVQGTVGGSSGQVQYNNGGTFAGAANVYIGSTGYLGIGTTAPLTALDVRGPIQNVTNQSGTLPTVNTSVSSAGGTYLGWDGMSGTPGETDFINIYRNSGNTLNGGFAFFNMASTTAVNTAPLMYIAPSGNVGIGTTAPSTALQVNGTVTASNAIITGGAPQVTVYTYTGSAGTYTTPTNALYLTVEMVGGGGEGGGSGTSAATGTAGQASYFGSSGTTACGTTALLVACGGAGGGVAGNGGGSGGGSAAGGDVNISGGNGSGVASNTNAAGGVGGISYFGGAGLNSVASVDTGFAATAGTGSGGSGASCSGTTFAGAGGAAGGYVRKLISSPASSYAYYVGNGGSGSNAGTGGQTGGAGGSGIIIVTAYFR